LKRQDVWIDNSGFLAKSAPTGAWPMMKLPQLEKGLAALLAEYEEWEKEAVYAELLEYARRFTQRYEKTYAKELAKERAERKRQARSREDDYRYR
jgi:uncharacterized protein YdiU (UPF0061 family)